MKKNKKIQVAVRMRPLLQLYEDEVAWIVNEKNKTVTSIAKNSLKNISNILNQSSEESMLKKRHSKVDKITQYQFQCDYVFGIKSTNRNVYDQCCHRIVNKFIDGQSGTIFMYGQTTSGKTYTMLGDVETSGLIHHAVDDIFEGLSKQLVVVVSYIEIYNEQVNDLLNPGATNLKIVEDQVQGLLEYQVDSPKETLQLLNTGEHQRSYSEKKYHDHSSRSHTVFRIKIMNEEFNRIQGVLNLVDLSGSERINEEDQSNEQTGYINKSLFVLSNVISKLGNAKKKVYVPFRDSKLTRLLAPALTSNNNTIVICTISPADINFSQSLSTLRFAIHSKKAQLKQHNESTDSSENRKKISILMQENSILKRNLSFAQQVQMDEKYLSLQVKRLKEKIKIQADSNKHKFINWNTKSDILCEQYEDNIKILQQQYVKALINMSSNELQINKSIIQNIIIGLN